MLVHIEFQKLAMFPVAVAITVLRVRVPGIIFFRGEQFTVRAFLKLDEIASGESCGNSYHFPGDFDIAFMITADLGYH
jgi:hypothetical protein